AAVVVDVPGAQRDARELAQLVGLLVGQAPAAEARDGVGAVLRLSAQDRGRDAVEGLVPGDGPQRGTLVIASQWRGEPVGMAQQRSRGGALPAQPAAVRRE